MPRHNTDPRRWQRHGRDIQGISELFSIESSDPNSPRIVAPWLADTVQITYPYPPEYGVENVPAPVAGAELTFTIPHNQHWRIISLSFRFLADANVANRLPRIQLQARSGTVVFTTFPAAVQTANQDRRYVMGAFGYDFGTADPTFRAIPCPVEFVAPDDFTLLTNTSGVQAGDQYSDIRLFRARVSS